MRFLELDKVLKLNMEDETINPERSNQIALKWRSSQPDWGRLENQIKMINQIYRMEKNFLNGSKNIRHSYRTSQPGCLGEGEFIKDLFNWLSGNRQ